MAKDPEANKEITFEMNYRVVIDNVETVVPVKVKAADEEAAYKKANEELKAAHKKAQKIEYISLIKITK